MQVIHLVDLPLNGHVLHADPQQAHDCWCEPAKLWIVKNIHNVSVLVVEHNDYTTLSRRLQLEEQAAGLPAHLAWINRALYSPATYPTAEHRDLPKKEPNA